MLELELEMDGNNSISTGLEWENLALFTGNPNNLHIPISSSSSSSCNEFGLGLGHGHHNEYPTRPLMSSSSSSIPVSSMPMPMPMPMPLPLPLPLPTKRSRASYHNMQNPCCQVEGCNLDLKLAKDYHRRHRICETHSKSPKVIVAGMERRFCQQCSRFHDLSEFDDKKRSCRRRLSDHNARRRRVQPDSATSPAALYAADHQRQQNVLLNGLPVSTWENGVIRARGLQGTTLNFGATDDDLSNLHTSSNHCGSSNSSSMAHPDLLSAHSLLSSNSWSLNQGEEGNYSPDLTLFQTNNNVNIINANGGDGGGGGGGLGLHNPHAHAHQEYHLFKSPYDDSASFFSTQRTL